MTDIERLESELDAVPLHLLGLIADALEDAGDSGLAAAYRWLKREQKVPRFEDDEYMWYHRPQSPWMGLDEDDLPTQRPVSLGVGWSAGFHSKSAAYRFAAESIAPWLETKDAREKEGEA